MEPIFAATRVNGQVAREDALICNPPWRTQARTNKKGCCHRLETDTDSSHPEIFSRKNETVLHAPQKQWQGWGIR